MGQVYQVYQGTIRALSGADADDGNFQLKATAPKARWVEGSASKVGAMGKEWRSPSTLHQNSIILPSFNVDNLRGNGSMAWSIGDWQRERRNRSFRRHTK